MNNGRHARSASLSTDSEIGPLRYLLVKVAARCNIACDYCYWFRDESVYRQPKVMSPEIEATFLARLHEHIATYGINEFSLLLHGGEPLLLGIDRFRTLVERLRAVEKDLCCKIDIAVTTNATLVNSTWAALFRDNAISVSVSLDGDPAINDVHRRAFSGEGTHFETVRGLRQLQDAGLQPQLLAVCEPNTDPYQVLRHFVDELGIYKFDIMIPDITRNETPSPIAPYYKRLFDLWFDEYSTKGVEVRFLTECVRGLLGGLSKVETTGFGPVYSATMLTDGSIEPLDVARITGNGSTWTGLNIQTNPLQAIVASSLWQELYEASLSPHAACRKCRFLNACGGGYLPHRFSKESRFNNPSVYCDDLLDMFEHIQSRVGADEHVRR